MRGLVTIAGLLIALSFGGGQALAFQEMPAPPPESAAPAAAKPKSQQDPLRLGTPGNAEAPQPDAHPAHLAVRTAGQPEHGGELLAAARAGALLRAVVLPELGGVGQELRRATTDAPPAHRTLLGHLHLERPAATTTAHRLDDLRDLVAACSEVADVLVERHRASRLISSLRSTFAASAPWASATTARPSSSVLVTNFGATLRSKGSSHEVHE